MLEFPALKFTCKNPLHSLTPLLQNHSKNWVSSQQNQLAIPFTYFGFHSVYLFGQKIIVCGEKNCCKKKTYISCDKITQKLSLCIMHLIVYYFLKVNTGVVDKFVLYFFKGFKNMYPHTIKKIPSRSLEILCHEHFQKLAQTKAVRSSLIDI